MGGVLDFLFEGQPPPSVTTYGSTVENLPPWLSDYTQALIGRANQAAALPYETYSGPRIAGLTDDQKSARGMIRDSMGNWIPQLDKAGALAEAAGGVDPLGAASPYLTGASKTFPGSVTEYMNPYTENVVNRAKDVAMRNWDESLLPQIQAMFTAGGQYGSTRMADKVLQGARGVTENIQSQADAALSDAYTQAGQMFTSDANRQGALAGTVGNLATAGGQLDLASSQQMGAIAEALQNMGLKDASALDAIGQQEQELGQKNLDLAYSDFERQRDYPQAQLGWLSDIIRGTPHSRTTTQQETGPLPGATYGASGISQVGSAITGIKGIWDLVKDWFAEGGVVEGPLAQYAGGGKVKPIHQLITHFSKGHLSPEDTVRIAKKLQREGKATETEIHAVLDSVNFRRNPITSTPLEGWLKSNQARSN